MPALKFPQVTVGGVEVSHPGRYLFLCAVLLVFVAILRKLRSIQLEHEDVSVEGFDIESQTDFDDYVRIQTRSYRDQATHPCDEDDDNVSTIALLESPTTASRAHQIHALIVKLRSASYASRHDADNVQEHILNMDRLRKQIAELVNQEEDYASRPPPPSPGFDTEPPPPYIYTGSVKNGDTDSPPVSPRIDVVAPVS